MIVRLPPRVVAVAATVLLMPFTPPAQPQDGPVGEALLIKAGRVITMVGPDLQPGEVLVRNGKIAAVGRGLAAPGNAVVIDAPDKIVMPGLIDAYSALLLDAGGSGAARPDADVRDAIDPHRDREVESALAQGVTAAAIIPGQRSGIAGTVAVVRLVPAASRAEMVVAGEAALKGAIGLGSYGRAIARLNEAESLRGLMKKAVEYRQALETYEEELAEYAKELEARAAKEAKEKEKGAEPAKDGEDQKKENQKKEGDEQKRGRKEGKGLPRTAEEGGEEKPGAGEGEKQDEAKKEELKKPKKPELDSGSEAVLRAMRGEIPLIVEAHRAADILNVLEIAAEFPVRLVLAGCTEAHLVADAIAASGATVVLSPAMRPAALENSEFRNQVPWSAAELAAVKIPVVLASSGRSPEETRHLSLAAAQAVAGGLDARRALEAVTIGPARLLGVFDRIGSIEKGKDADLVILRGEPLSSAAAVDAVFVLGKEVFRRRD